MNLSFSAADWLALFTHFASLSLLAVGGAITTVPDMHRYLVTERLWLSESQFTSSVAMAQAAPGPNLLFVALMGWNVGMNAAHSAGAHPGAYALAGVALSMLGILLPSTTLTFMAARWGHQNRERRSVRAFKTGMAPIVVALLVATGWILATSLGQTLADWHVWLVSFAAAMIVWRTKIHLLWLLGAGGLLGWLGWL
jgi:chromate transporter